MKMTHKYFVFDKSRFYLNASIKQFRRQLFDHSNHHIIQWINKIDSTRFKQ